MEKSFYELLPNNEHRWCKTHKRKATHKFHGKGWACICCDPNLGGITMPCIVEPLKRKI
jgi:hypothetical protein